jgi:3-methyladenine DNA glycosylase AlkC
MQEDFQLRDVFNPTIVNKLAQDIQQTWPEFDAAGFTTDINSHLERLNFGARSNLIRDKLGEYLPPDFPEAAQILIDSLEPEPMVEELTGFDGFIIMPQCDFVAKFGLEHFDVSMRALYEMTKRFTAEGAIRPFLQKYPAQTLKFLEQLAHDPSPLARRLASEGTRSRLPLAPRLPQFIKDPRPVLKLLDKLRADPTLLVRRSVANNLNDIAKDNPDVVVEILREWQKSQNKDTQWLINHASRTLVKQGHREALALLGYPPNPTITVQNLTLRSSHVSLGETLSFSFEIGSDANEAQNLMIDYVIHHMKANGKLAPKVFKLSSKKLKAGETLRLSKNHSFRRITTRVYYPGQHKIGIQINGQVLAEAEFELRF